MAERGIVFSHGEADGDEFFSHLFAIRPNFNFFFRKGDQEMRNMYGDAASTEAAEGRTPSQRELKCLTYSRSGPISASNLPASLPRPTITFPRSQGREKSGPNR